MRVLICFLVLSITLSAHPHVFMEAEVSLDIKEGNLRGIHYNINLDEMNSALLAMRYSMDEDGNLILDDGELLTPDNYPLDETEMNVYRIRYNNREIENLDIQLKKIYMDDIYFTYEIYIPLDIEVEEGDKINISIYDKEYYLDYYYDEYSIKMNDGTELPYEFSLTQNKDVTYYMGIMNPVEYEVVF